MQKGDGVRLLPFTGEAVSRKREHTPTTNEFATVITDDGEERRRLRAGEAVYEKLPNGVGSYKIVQAPRDLSVRQQRRAAEREAAKARR